MGVPVRYFEWNNQELLRETIKVTDIVADIFKRVREKSTRTITWQEYVDALVSAKALIEKLDPNNSVLKS